MWGRKRFNTGIRVFFETCPTCLVESIQKKRPEETIAQIQSLNENVETLVADNAGEGHIRSSLSKNLKRLQLELQFIGTEIEESGSCSEIDTSAYTYVVGRIETCLEEIDDNNKLDSARHCKPPTLLEQVKELRVSMITQLKKQRGGPDEKVLSAYALIDVLKQLEAVESNVELDTLLLHDEERKELRDEVDRLQANLEHVQYVIGEIPLLSKFSHSVGVLSDLYLNLLQYLDAKLSENEQNRELRERMEIMEKQHADEVKALRSQLNTFMNTTVAANVLSTETLAPVDVVAFIDEEDKGEVLRNKIEEMEREHVAVVGALQSQLDTLMASIPAAANAMAEDSISGSLEEMTRSQELLVQETESSVIDAEIVDTFPIGRHPSIGTVEAEVLTSSHTFACFTSTNDPDANCSRNIRRIKSMSEIDLADSVPIECKHANFISAQVTNSIRRVKSMTDIVDVDTTSPTEQTESKLLAKTADANHQTTFTCSPNAIATEYFAFTKDDPSESKIHNADLATISSFSMCALPASHENLPILKEEQMKEPNSTSCRTKIPRCGGYFQTERDTPQIGEAEGINLILRAARLFPHDSNAQMCGLLTIHNLTKNSNETTEISHKDCIEMVLRGMQEFPEDVQITTIGLTALESFASMGCDNRSMIGNMGGVDVVLSCMHHFHFPENAEIWEKCCSTIALLAKSPKTRSELRCKGALKAIRKTKALMGGNCSSASRALFWLEKDSLVQEWDM
jgi:hypothetical protein